MRSTTNWMGFVFLLLTGAASATAQQVPQYQFQVLDEYGYVGATGLNNQGVIIASRYDGAVFYTDGAFQRLSVHNFSQANGINDSSEIVGTDFLGGGAVIYKEGREQPIQEQPIIVGGVQALTATDINNQGQITGAVKGAHNNAGHGYIYQNGAAVDTGVGYPTRINSRGELTGGSIYIYEGIESPGYFYGSAFFYTHGNTQTIGLPGEYASVGTGIDSSGRVAGYTRANGGGGDGRAFIYINGKLNLLFPPNQFGSYATGMNDCGEVIGGSAAGGFLYTHGQIRYLVDLFPATSDETALTPTAINDEGVIVGTIIRNSMTSTFIMTPLVPEHCGSDVTIDNNPDAATIRPGGEIDYTILVKNLASPTTKFAVKDELGVRTIFQSCSVTGTTGTCERTADKDVISISLPDLAKGATATINLVAKGYSTAGDDQLIANTATVSSSATSDYLSTAYTTVRESADIGISMTLAENHGGTLHYLIQVANAGPDNSHAVLLSDTLPQGLKFVSATTTAGDCDHHPAVGTSGLLLCRIGNTPHQGTAQVDLIVQTAVNAGSPVTDTVSVLAKSVDSNQANNSATVTAMVAP